MELKDALIMKEKLYESLKKLYPVQLNRIAKKYPDFPEIDKIEDLNDLESIFKEVEKSLKNQDNELKSEVIQIIEKSVSIENKSLVNILFAQGYRKEEIYRVLDEMHASGLIKKIGSNWAEVVWKIK
ncbi:MAG: hypothetical protein PHW96_01565 [Candidatus Nanoarchaeia archaeon]|nr:hypothetical protein [Candidatus Nanoarchaeia archaeon]